MSFTDILGQDKPIAVLQHALRHNRVAQAYVFAGPDGIGKKLTALTLAKALNCKEKDDDACDHCVSCHKIDEGNHPDVRIIEPDGQFIKIDQVRDMQKDVGFKAFEGKRKVYILDQADAMRPESANALLKTLEEPSADCVIILITANVYALLSTVMSRCQFLRFVSLGAGILSDLLVQHHQFTPEQARLVASLSEGCPGHALAMDAEAALEKRNLVQQLLMTLSSGLQDVRVIFTQVETLLEDKNLIQEFLDMMLMWYRDMYVLQEEADTRLIANADAISALQQGAEGVSLRQLRKLFEIVYQTKLDILRNANLQLALEVMLISLVEVYNDRSHWR